MFTNNRKWIKKEVGLNGSIQTPKNLVDLEGENKMSLRALDHIPVINQIPKDA